MYYQTLKKNGTARSQTVSIIQQHLKFLVIEVSKSTSRRFFKHRTEKNELVVSVIVFSKHSIQNIDNTNMFQLNFYLDNAVEMNKHKNYQNPKGKRCCFCIFITVGAEKYLRKDRAI